MTQKRFEYKNHKVFDNLTGEEHSSNMVSVNVLNDLYEEKEEIKQQNNKLFKIIRIVDRIITEYMPFEVVYEWKNALKELKE